MDGKIEKIINDLYALDPSLRERDKDIRAIVVLLIESQPTVSADEAFVRNLRLRLLSLSSGAGRKIPGFSWWALRLAPLGAIAILLLVFFPELTKPVPYGTPLTPAPSAIPLALEMPTPESARSLSDEKTESPGVLSVPEAAPKSLTMMAVSANFVNVSSQKPGSAVTIDFVEIEKPGFVVIRADKSGALGEILGESALLPAERSEKIRIDLFRPMREGETLRAALYADDGDDIFDASKDGPFLDAVTNSPIYMVFTVTIASSESGPGL